MRTQVFVDESKARGLLVAAAVCVSGDVNRSRKRMRALLLGGERRIHFKKESDPRRRKIVAAIADMDVSVRLYGRTTDDAAGRRACLDAVVRDASDNAERLVIERDESTLAFDRRVLFEATRRHGCADSLTYELLAPYADPMLWIPDAVAWCWTRGGDWRDAVASFSTRQDI